MTNRQTSRQMRHRPGNRGRDCGESFAIATSRADRDEGANSGSMAKHDGRAFPSLPVMRSRKPRRVEVLQRLRHARRLPRVPALRSCERGRGDPLPQMRHLAGTAHAHGTVRGRYQRGGNAGARFTAFGRAALGGSPTTCPAPHCRGRGRRSGAGSAGHPRVYRVPRSCTTGSVAHGPSAGRARARVEPDLATRRRGEGAAWRYRSTDRRGERSGNAAAEDNERFERRPRWNERAFASADEDERESTVEEIGCCCNQAGQYIEKGNEFQVSAGTIPCPEFDVRRRHAREVNRTPTIRQEVMRVLLERLARGACDRPRSKGRG